MEMSQDEANVLLKHLIVTLKKNDLNELHEMISSNIESSDNQYKYLLNYIDHIISYFEMFAQNTKKDILSNFNEYIQTENGNKIDDINIFLNENESILIGKKYLSFTDFPDYGDLVNEIKEIKNIIFGNYDEYRFT